MVDFDLKVVDKREAVESDWPSFGTLCAFNDGGHCVEADDALSGESGCSPKDHCLTVRTHVKRQMSRNGYPAKLINSIFCWGVNLHWSFLSRSLAMFQVTLCSVVLNSFAVAGRLFLANSMFVRSSHASTSLHSYIIKPPFSFVSGNGLPDVTQSAGTRATFFNSSELVKHFIALSGFLIHSSYHKVPWSRNKSEHNNTEFFVKMIQCVWTERADERDVRVLYSWLCLSLTRHSTARCEEGVSSRVN